MKHLVLIMSLFLASFSLSAATMNFTGTLNGLPVDVGVNYSISGNTLTVIATNNEDNPTSVIQALSAFNFTLSGGLTGTLSSVMGTMIDIDSMGVPSFSSTTPDWYQPGISFYTTALGSTGPDNTLIGMPGSDGKYSNANGSITGNGPHNPFAQGELTFTYMVSGLTANTQMENVSLFFGTGPTPLTQNDPPSGVPEPTTMGLFGVSLVAGAAMRKKLTQ